MCIPGCSLTGRRFGEGGSTPGAVNHQLWKGSAAVVLTFTEDEVVTIRQLCTILDCVSMKKKKKNYKQGLFTEKKKLAGLSLS